MESKIVPFGKYKGQPIEVLQQDLPYLEWLKNQDWFKQKYQQFNTVVINNFQEPSETPEHNKLCNLFLDESNCYKLFRLVVSQFDIKESKKILSKAKNEDPIKPKIFIPDSQTTIQIPSLKDINYRMAITDENYKDELIKQKIIKEITVTPQWTFVPTVFEDKSIDVKFSYYDKNGNFNPIPFFIEVKPCIGDDYPAILRHVNNNECQYVIGDKFTAAGATIEQVKEIFKRSKKTLILFSEFL